MNSLFQILEEDISSYKTIEVFKYTNIEETTIQDKKSLFSGFWLSLYSEKDENKTHWEVVDFSKTTRTSYKYSLSEWMSYKKEVTLFSKIENDIIKIVSSVNNDKVNIYIIRLLDSNWTICHFTQPICLVKNSTKEKIKKEISRSLEISFITWFSKSGGERYPYYDDDFWYSSFVSFWDYFYRKEFIDIYTSLQIKYSELFTQRYFDELFCGGLLYREGYNFQNLIVIWKLKNIADTYLDNLYSLWSQFYIKYKKSESMNVFYSKVQKENDLLWLELYKSYNFLERYKEKLSKEELEYIFMSKSLEDFTKRVANLNFLHCFIHNLWLLSPWVVKNSIETYINCIENTNWSLFDYILLTLPENLKKYGKYLVLLSKYNFYFESKDYLLFCYENKFFLDIKKFERIIWLETVYWYFTMREEDQYEIVYRYYKTFYKNLYLLNKKIKDFELLKRIIKIYSIWETYLSQHDLYYDVNLYEKLIKFTTREIKFFLSTLDSEKIIFDWYRQYLSLFIFTFSDDILKKEYNLTFKRYLSENKWKSNYEHFTWIQNWLDSQFFKMYKFSKKEQKLLNQNRNILLQVWINWFSILRITFEGNVELFKKILLGDIQKNIISSTQTISKYYINNWSRLELIDNYFKELVGTKDQKWIANKPWKLYKEIKDKNLLELFSVNDKFLFDSKRLLSEYNKWFSEIVQFKVVLENISSARYWCAGDFSKCCMWYTSSKMKDYIKESWYWIVNIFYNDLVIWNSLVWLGYIWWKKTLIVDNIEINTQYKKYIPYFWDLYKKYLFKLQRDNNCKEIVVWSNFNDVQIINSEEIDLNQEKLYPLWFILEKKEDDEKTTDTRTFTERHKLFLKRFYSDLWTIVKKVTLDTQFS